MRALRRQLVMVASDSRAGVVRTQRESLAGVEQFGGSVRQVLVVDREKAESSRVFDPLLTCPSAPPEVDVERLYFDHGHRLRALAASVTFDRDVADEITHDAFAALASRCGEVRDPVAYLRRSVINLSISHVRRRNRARYLPVRRIEHTTIPEIDDVWDVLADLSPRQRAVIVLRFYEDQTYEQIAATLDMPTGSVKSTLHRALSTLEERL